MQLLGEAKIKGYIQQQQYYVSEDSEYAKYKK